jgi:DNA repair exonuclease SbcCD ATPase subunit
VFLGEKVLSVNKLFFFREEKDLNIYCWMFIGPFFISLTLFLTSFSTVPNKDLFLLSIVGLWLCLKKGEKGFFYSISFLAILTIFKHFEISSHHIWQLGIEFSLFLGFMISYYSIEYINDFMENIDINKKQQIEDISKIQEELKKEEDFHQRQHKNFKYEIERVNLQIEEKKTEISSFKNLVENLRKTIQEKEQEQKELIYRVKEEANISSFLRQEIEDMKQHILNIEDQDLLVKRNESLLNELNLSQVEKEQIYSVNQSLTESLSKEINIRKEEEKQKSFLLEKIEALEERILYLQNESHCLKQELLDEKDKSNDFSLSQNIEDKKLLHHYEKKYLELKKHESLYDQLRTQFNDKNKVLAETRKELFHVTEQLEAIGREKEMKGLDETLIDRALYRQLGVFEEEIASIEEENEHLQEIVSCLNQSLK